MTKIELSDDKYSEIDDVDLHIVNYMNWNFDGKYAARSIWSTKNRSSRKVYLHRFIWELHNGPIPDGMTIDHVNNDKLDNQLKNLRLATSSQNNINKFYKTPENTSIFKGVAWNNNANKWRVLIKINSKVQHVGYFEDEIDAAIAYDLKAIELFGERAYLNFLKDVEE